jgi:hypothetical protein
MQKEIIFGSKEWIEELNKRVKFPQMFAIYYGVHKESNVGTLNAVMLETKSTEPKNLKLGTLSPTLGMVLAPYQWSLINAYYIKDADDYVKSMTKLSEQWNVEFNN